MQVGGFMYSGFSVSSLSGNVGSLAGGLPLAINIGGAGLPPGLDATSLSVTVGGLACPLIGSATSPTQVLCSAPAAPQGYGVAEYYYLGVNRTFFPYFPFMLSASARPPAGKACLMLLMLRDAA